MKTFLKVFGGLAFLIIIAALATPFLLNPNTYKGEIIAQVQNVLGREIRIDGDIKLRFLPRPKIKLRDIKIASIPGTHEEYLADLGFVEINFQLLPLFKGRLDINRIRLERARIVLEQLPDNRTNWDIKVMASKSSKPATTTSKEPPKEGMLFDVDHLVIKDSQVIYIAPKTKHDVKDINLEIELDSIKGPYQVNGSLSYLDQPLNIKGKVETITNIIPADIAIEAFNQKIELEGQANLESQTFEGELKVKGHTKDFSKLFPDLKLPEAYLQEYKIKSQCVASSQKVTARNFELIFGNINALGNGTFDIKNLQTNLKLNINPGDAGFSLATHIDPKYLFNGSVKLIVQDLAVLLNTLKLDSGEIPKELTKNLKVAADISYKKDEILLNNISFNQGDAQLEGSISLQNLSKIPSYRYELKTPNLQTLAKLIVPDFGYDLGAVAVKGESSGTLDDLKTSTHVMSPLVHIATQGGLQIKDSGKTSKISYNLTFSAEGPNLKSALTRLGINVGQQNIGKYNISAQLKGDPARIAATNINGEVAMGRSFLTWTGSAEGMRSPLRPKISANLSFGALNIDTLFAEAPKPYHDLLKQGRIYLVAHKNVKAEEAPRPKHSERWSHEKIDLSFLQSFDGDFKLSLPKVHYGSFVFQDMQTTAKVVNGVLEVPNLTARTFGGGLTVKFRASSQQGQPINFKIAIADANLKDIAPQKGKIHIVKGKLNLQADLNTTGNSEFQYIKNLAGSINLTAKDGVINGFDLQKVNQQLGLVNNLSSALRLLNTSFEGGQTNFSSLEGVFAVSEGVARITRMTLAAQGANANATGKISLPAYTLNIDSTIQLNDLPKFPPFGVRLYGSLDDPQHALNTDVLQQYLIENVFSKVIEDVITKRKKPKELLKGILNGPDKGSEQDKPSEQPSDKPDTIDDVVKNPEKAIGSILKKLL